MNHLTRARSVFEMEIEELRGVLSRLDENFNKAVDLMSLALDRGNKIVIAGVGKSGNVGAKIVATLNSTGTPTVSAVIWAKAVSAPWPISVSPSWTWREPS